MRCLAVCQTELAIRMLDEVLLPNFEIEFLVEGKPLAKRLHDSGLNVSAGDPRRTDTYIKADLSPGTCVVVEDDGRHSLKKIIEAIFNAGGTLVYVLGVGAASSPEPCCISRKYCSSMNRLPGSILNRAALYGIISAQ